MRPARTCIIGIQFCNKFIQRLATTTTTTTSVVKIASEFYLIAFHSLTTAMQSMVVARQCGVAYMMTVNGNAYTVKLTLIVLDDLTMLAQKSCSTIHDIFHCFRTRLHRVSGVSYSLTGMRNACEPSMERTESNATN